MPPLLLFRRRRPLDRRSSRSRRPAAAGLVVAAVTGAVAELENPTVDVREGNVEEEVVAKAGRVKEEHRAPKAAELLL